MSKKADKPPTWDRNRIVELLESNDAAVERALILLLGRQDLDEQEAEEAIRRNARGFTGCDAEFMTSLAKQVEDRLRQGRRLGHCLSRKQMDALRKRDRRGVMNIGKYWKQLIEEIVSKQGTKEVAPCQSSGEH